MATMQGITGKLSGKMGSAVFAVRKGQQIIRQYNPIVLNPKSARQQDSRVKFKLASQLAAIMAPGFGTLYTAKRKATKGTPSKRNIFTELNYPLITTEVMGDDLGVVAQIDMECLQLTSSMRNDLPNPIVSGAEQSGLLVTIDNPPVDVTIVRFVVVGYVPGTIPHTNQPTILGIADAKVDRGRVQILFDGTDGIPKIGNDVRCTVLAYGMIPTSSAAADKLNNLFAPDAEFVSAVQLDNLVKEGVMSETKTKGANFIP